MVVFMDQQIQEYGQLGKERKWPADGKLVGLFSSLAVAGSIAGNRLAARLPVKRLRQGSAAMVLLTGAWVLWRNLVAG
jgi:uncharacterized membrane protein YfcA